MATLKCFACGKIMYPMEAIGAGDNKYHKFCFKCEVCKINLTLKNSQQKGTLVYCSQHVPKDVPTSTADRADITRVKDAPKLATVNQQFRGELVGQKSNIDMEAASIKNVTNAPKIATVNVQLRGELVGQKSGIDMEAAGIKNAMAAPKVGTVNEQLRGELVGQKSSIDMEASGIKNALQAPKLDTQVGVKKGDQNLEPVKGEIYHC